MALLDSLAPAGTHRDAAARLWLPGMMMTYRHFHDTQDLVSKTQQLVRHDGRLRQLMSGPGVILLSGQADEQHLMIMLRDDAPGISGVASVLQAVDAETAERPGGPERSFRQGVVPADPDPSWRMLLAHRILLDGQPVVQTIHAVTQAPAVLAAQWQASLPKQGWRAVLPAAADASATEWLHGGSHVQLLPAPDGRGSIVYQTYLP